MLNINARHGDWLSYNILYLSTVSFLEMSEVVYVIKLKKDNDQRFNESNNNQNNLPYDYQISSHGKSTSHKNIVLPSEQRYIWIHLSLLVYIIVIDIIIFYNHMTIIISYFCKQVLRQSGMWTWSNSCSVRRIICYFCDMCTFLWRVLRGEHVGIGIMVWIYLCGCRNTWAISL